MRSLIVFAALGLATACSHKDDGLANKVSTVRGFCDEWGTRACNDNVVKLCAAETKDACIESQQSFCESLVSEDKYSPKTALECLTAVQVAYSKGMLDAKGYETVVHLGNECDKILSGSGTAGKPCTADSDCDRDEDLACVKKGSATGKCEVPTDPPLGGGYSCKPDEAVCIDGFYCDGTNCLKEKTEGDDCTAAVPCDSDSHCVDAKGNVVGPESTADGGGEATGTCTARKSTGSDCANDDDCKSHICALSGKSSMGVCANQISFGPSEGVCTHLR